MATRHSRSSATGEYPTQHRRNVDAQGRKINPYHMTYCSSYNPVSAQDSELQSLSSDALTDTDTLGSLTDSSSVDRYPVVQTERFRKRQVKQVRNQFGTNNDASWMEEEEDEEDDLLLNILDDYQALFSQIHGLKKKRLLTDQWTDRRS